VARRRMTSRVTRSCPGHRRALALTWYFNRQGRYHTNNDGDTPVQSVFVDSGRMHAVMSGVTAFRVRVRRKTKICAWIAAGHSWTARADVAQCAQQCATDA
jgi:hypothetical protein